jgi:hypothetical protein
VLVGVGVFVGVGVLVGVLVGVAVLVGVGVLVGVLVGVPVAVGVCVAVAVGVLVNIDTAKAAALVAVTEGCTMGSEGDCVDPTPLATKKPRATTSVAPKASMPRRERCCLDRDEYKLSLHQNLCASAA